jgi:hypothetical protein
MTKALMGSQMAMNFPAMSWAAHDIQVAMQTSLD